MDALNQTEPADAGQHHVCLTGGWFSSDNVGDQAILVGITDAFAEQLPARFSVITAAPDKVTADHGLPAFAPKKAPFQLVRNLLSADALVFTGGTPFYDAKPHLSYYATLARIARARGIPVIAFGVSLRSIKSRYCRALMGSIARSADFLGAREEKTLQALQRFTDDEHKVEMVPDAAIQMRPSDPNRAATLLSEAGVDPSARNAAICLRDFRSDPRFQLHHYSRRYEPATLERYHTAIRKAAEHCVRRHDSHVVFCPMHTAGQDDDRRVAAEIRAAIRDEGVRRCVTVLKRQHTPRDMKAILGSMHINIGVRFHSLVLATSMLVPSVAIAYAQKSLALMNYIQQGEYASDIAEIDADQLCGRIDDLIAHHGATADQLRRRYAEINAAYSSQVARVGELIARRSGKSKPSEVTRQSAMQPKGRAA